ncbi:MAG: glycosyltransferase, partial [Candidatus Aenigmarchaeota archaeon]|nr:glycosyltransferase [Candidatus Aenigmarchaeota archaeon]
GIVYPPVDTEIFKPRSKKKKGVLLYLGSNAGDTESSLIEEICELLINKNQKVSLLGNKRLAEKLSSTFGDHLHHISGVTDKDLSLIYSQSRLTICPQQWEQFGYVVAESMACGTPVIAFNYMGPAEIIEDKKVGYLVNTNDQFLNKIEEILDYRVGIKRSIVRKYSKRFSMKSSTEELCNILE